MKNYSKIDILLKKIRGHILSEAVLVEIDLTLEIEGYFFKKKNKKSNIFSNDILGSRKFTFNDKIDLFKKILKTKKLENKSQITRGLKFIKRLRNFVAHGDLLYSKSNQKKVVLQDINNKKRLEITNNTIEKFNEHICNFHKQICHGHIIIPEEFKTIFV